MLRISSERGAGRPPGECWSCRLDQSDFLLLCGWQQQAATAIHQTMQGLRSLCQQVQIPLECFGESVEQAPRGQPLLELFMPWLTPFFENVGHASDGNDLSIHGADEKVMRLRVGQLGLLVG